MRASSTQVVARRSLAAIFLLLSLGETYASECVKTNEVVPTSQVAVQVFSGSLKPVEGAVVSLVWQYRQGSPAATGKTDSNGALEIEGVPPGLYSLEVTMTDGSPVLVNGKSSISTQVNVRVVPSSEQPARLIAIWLRGGMDCRRRYCDVPVTASPLTRPPKCLTQRLTR
jgi:hypothetical protein